MSVICTVRRTLVMFLNLQLRVSLILLAGMLSLAAPAESLSDGGQLFQDRKILVLHSYGPDYSWTISLNEGIKSILNDLDWSNTVRYEYMDTKNVIGTDYYESLRALYRQKYARVKFDGLVVTDNNAMLFLDRYGEELFGNVPMVAIGINGVGSIPLPSGNMTIIPEEISHEQTLRQAKQLRPESRDCYVLVDSTVTGKAVMAEVQAIEPAFEGELTLLYIDQLSFEELLSFVALLNPDDIVYLLPFFRDVADNTFPHGNVAKALARYSPAPIFVSWEFQLNTGALGGAVISGHRLGEFGATTLLNILNGQKVEALVRLPDSNTLNVYDYRAMQRYGIAEKELPPDSRIINKPLSFFGRHRAVLLPALAIIATLTIILLLILKMLKKETIINQNNQLILNLNEEVINTQRELVATLGEVIETRSQETGNHVKRVAKISRVLGEKVGLSYDELEVLEAASPLHDVGKIGIPDSILNRPGKLSKGEFVKMQEHTKIGKDILRYSDRKLLSAACSIAYQHHERWDGSGYPEGLSGEQIDIFARITSLADVYDALSSDRCYKDAWPEEKVLRYIRTESGNHFDPELVRTFFAHLSEIREIKKQYS